MMRCTLGRAPLLACGLAVSVLLGAGAASALAQQDQAQQAEPDQALAPYAGIRLVRVVPDQKTYQAALDTATSVWTHRPAPGRAVELLVSDDGIAALTDLGLAPVVLIDDIQREVDAHMELVTRLAAQRGANWYDNYKTYNEIVTRVQGMAAARPDLASTSVFGSSLEGRDLVEITITGPDQPGNMGGSRPVVLLNGCQHAREWVSPMTVTYLADELIARYDSDPRVRALLDSARVVIAPMVNPDGYVYSWTNERFWRKNRRGGFGVDLNRNWGYEWGGEGSSGSTDSEIYRGTAPFSEPETAALRDLSLSFGPDLVSHLDYHSFSQLVLWPFGYDFGVTTPEPDRTLFDNLSNEMSASIQSVYGEFYTPMQSVDLYPAAGDSSDWYYGQLGVTSFTIELRDTGSFGFVLPPDQILPTAEENFEGMLLFAERTTQLLSFSLVAPVPAFVEAGQTNDLDVNVVEGVGTLDSSSVRLHARVGGVGSFVETPGASVGGDTYRLTLPAAPCAETIEFFITAQTLAGQTLAFPSGGESAPLSVDAAELTTIFADNFESNLGWSVSGNVSGTASGVWERAVPNGGGDRGDPVSDFDGSGRCFLTGAADGNTDVDGGTTILTSPAFDLSANPEASIAYSRWFSNNAGGAPDEDVMLVEISSNNGASWTEVETVGPNTSESGGGWFARTVRVADFVAPSAQVRLRFSASDLGSGSVVEAGVDAVRVEEAACSSPGGCNAADLAAPFGTLDFSDVVAFLGAFGAMDPAADLAAPFGTLDFSDVVAFLGAFGAGCP